jgi:two-component system chemotaxis response regulator CheB
MSAKVRVLVVEDSPTVRDCIRKELDRDPDLAVVGEAGDGEQAIALCQRMRPDVITMDVVLPLLDGLAATEHIMAHFPTPILVVSGAGRAEAFSTYDALAAGAVDVIEKPRGDASDGDWGRRLRTTVKLVSRIKVVTRHRTTGNRAESAQRPPAPRTAGNQLRAVAIGASTGGPGAIVELLSALPNDFPVPILFVQHIAASESLAVAFTDWLGGQVGRRVTYARPGDPLAGLAGRVIVAPPDRHLVVRNGQVQLTADPMRHSCRPSVDTLFESVAAECGATAAGCLLTGMGRDGAAGLLALRRAGAYTFAQDEQSSVVYGMPREAMLLGAAAEVLPPARIAGRLAALTTTHQSTGGSWRTPF